MTFQPAPSHTIINTLGTETYAVLSATTNSLHESSSTRIEAEDAKHTNAPMEDRMNQARGHKAALNNPNVSDEAKKHSSEILRDEFGNQTSYIDEMEEDKNKGNV